MALVCLACLAVGCSKKVPDSQQAVSANQESSVADGNASYIECNGTVQPADRFVLRLGAGEHVSQLLVKEGDRVEKGEPLAGLTNDELAMQIVQLEEKEWQIRQAREELRLLEIEIDNEENIKKEVEEAIAEEHRIAERIPGYQLDKQTQQWRETLIKTEGQLRLLKEKHALQKQSCETQEELGLKQRSVLEELKTRAARLQVSAPFAGCVRRVHRSPEGIAPGEIILELWDTSAYVVHAHVWQNQLRSIAVGAEAEIFPDFYGSRSLCGTVQTIYPVDVDTHESQFPQFPVVVQLEAQDEALVVGMTVSARIYTSLSAAGED